MSNFLNRIKDRAKSTLDQASVPIPITPTMIQKLLDSVNLEGINDVIVEFNGDSILLSGTAKKLVTFPFSLNLVPVSTNDRKMYFTINKLKPINAEWIRNRVLNVPPFLAYDNQTVCIDLNGFDAISKIPVGTIRSFKLENKVLWVNIGI